MDLVATTVLPLVVRLTWTCLSTTPEQQKHPIYARLSSNAMLDQLLSSTSLVFSPGLSEVLQAPTPPPVSYFKSLSTVNTKLWAVYLLVLEKASCRPKIYIGSGTDAKSGVSARLGQYDTGNHVPRYVQKAIEDGYVITHKGLLCWASLPSAAEVPILRLVFLTLEATFTFIFRAIHKTDYGMAHMCHWARDTLEYDGLCSHNPLTEAPAGDHSLSPEELEAQAAEIFRRRAEYYREYRQKARADNLEEYKAKVNSNRRAYIKRNPEPSKAAEKRCIAKAVQEKKFYCAVCDHVFTRKPKLTAHLSGKRHAAKAARNQQC